MPKETVMPKDGDFKVQVGWSKSQHVQVGVELKQIIGVESPKRGPKLGSLPNLFWELCGEHREAIGAAVRKIIGCDCMDCSRGRKHGATTDSTKSSIVSDLEVGTSVLVALETICSPYSGVWATLNREDLNRLIHLLRTARNDAFGKDE